MGGSVTSICRSWATTKKINLKSVYDFFTPVDVSYGLMQHGRGYPHTILEQVLGTKIRITPNENPFFVNRSGKTWQPMLLFDRTNQGTELKGKVGYIKGKSTERFFDFEDSTEAGCDTRIGSVEDDGNICVLRDVDQICWEEQSLCDKPKLIDFDLLTFDFRQTDGSPDVFFGVFDANALKIVYKMFEDFISCAVSISVHDCHHTL